MFKIYFLKHKKMVYFFKYKNVQNVDLNYNFLTRELNSTNCRDKL